MSSERIAISASGERLHSRFGSLKTHTLRGSLPFCHLTLSAIKPKDRTYPAELNTIGDHLRKREAPVLPLCSAITCEP
jgi:hypothetical protein